jgi:hypothetical protein
MYYPVMTPIKQFVRLDARGKRIIRRFERDVSPWPAGWPIADMVTRELLSVVRRSKAATHSKPRTQILQGLKGFLGTVTTTYFPKASASNELIAHE